MECHLSQCCLLTMMIFSHSVVCCELAGAPVALVAPVAPGAPHVRYQLHIAGEPLTFEPGEHYTISLKSAERDSPAHTFHGFTLWSEVEGGLTNSSRGVFQPYDSHSKPHPTCSSALVNSTTLPKTEIQAMWNAPTDNTGCIVIAARITDDLLVTEAATLKQRLCAAAPAYGGAQTDVISPCCACDEAKYEVTFEGLWSRNTHPKDFPADERITRFSDVIGASHTVHYRFWEVGRVASQGLRELAEEGHTTTLEKELKAESDNIRTIIKARGMSWPRLGGSTFAVFRVDARRHLVSLVSRLSPSPDWVVGVSALELCRADCSWLEADAIDLYPYDAGTDSGITYMARRQRTLPPGAVRALRPDWPADPHSPFHDPSGARLKPFARITLTRQRLYEKNCDNRSAVSSSSEAGGGGGGGGGLSAQAPCETGAWGAWSECSATCGAGVALRQRYYRDPRRAHAHSCTRPLSQKKKCRGPRMHCRAPSEYEPDPALRSTGLCRVSTWSDWSPCSATDCARGVRVRSRHYVHHGVFKRCHVGWRTRPLLDQTLDCYGEQLNCSVETSTSADSSSTLQSRDYDIDAENTMNVSWVSKVSDASAEGWEEARCPVSAWGAWSPCSARCGRGWRMRTRFYIAPAFADPRAHQARALALQRRLVDHLTAIWNRRYAAWQGVEVASTTSSQSPEPPPELEELRRQLVVCEDTLTMQDAECEGDHPHCDYRKNAAETCGLPLAVGACRGHERRWFHDARRRSCEPFGYTGCRGNRNNFRTRRQCLDTCANYTGEPQEKVFHKNKHEVVPAKRSNEITEEVDSERSVRRRAAGGGGGGGDAGCRLEAWGGWSACVGDCGAGLKLNYRQLLNGGNLEGATCTAVLVRSRACTPPHCPRRRRHLRGDRLSLP